MHVLEIEDPVKPLILTRLLTGKFTQIFKINKNEFLKRREYRLVLSPVEGLVLLLKNNTKPFVEAHMKGKINVNNFDTHYAEWGLSSWSDWAQKMNIEEERRGYSYVVRRPVLRIKQATTTTLVQFMNYVPLHKHGGVIEANRLYVVYYVDGGGLKKLSKRDIEEGLVA